MPQLRWEGGKGANLRGKIKAVSSSEVSASCGVTAPLARHLSLGSLVPSHNC